MRPSSNTARVNYTKKTGHRGKSRKMSKFTSIQEVTESPQLPAKKSARRSLQMKSPSAKVLHDCTKSVSVEGDSTSASAPKRITRSNAFRNKASNLNRSLNYSFRNSTLDECSILEDEDDSVFVSNLKLNESLPVNVGQNVKRRSFKSCLEKRKTIKSIGHIAAIAGLNLSFA